jgi:Fic family protein
LHKRNLRRGGGGFRPKKWAVKARAASWLASHEGDVIDESGKPPYTVTTTMTGLVSEISELAGVVRHRSERAPVNPALRRDNQIRAVCSSLAIENNSLSLDEARDVIEGKGARGRPVEIREVKNAFKAYGRAEKLDPFSPSDLLEAHRIMMDSLIDEAGRFRSKGAGVYKGGELLHMGTPTGLVSGQVHKLLGWAKSTDEHPLIKSGAVHYDLELIHPFSDGNGRMGRLWQTVMLRRWKPVFSWLAIEPMIHDSRQEYYDVLSGCGKRGDCSEFIELMLVAIHKAMTELDRKTELDEKASVQVSRLVEALGEETLSARELLERLGLRSRQSFVTWHLRPALDLGLIEMTIQGKPNSRNQKYRRAEALPAARLEGAKASS